VTAVTRDTCWSVRQCTERAAALDAKADGVVQGLDAFETELGIGVGAFGSRCEEHQAAVTFIGQLLELVEHLQANLRYGFTMPATPAPAPRLPPTPPVTYLQPQAQPPSYKPPAVEAHVQLLDRAAAAVHCRLSIQGFDAQRRAGRVPAPHRMDGRIPLWHPDQLVNVRNAKPNSGRRS
jgi:hypothetical protein